MLRRTISKVLQDAGYRVTALAQVPAAMPAPFEGETPQLIVLGARLLDADMAAAAHRLRALEPSAPILAVADERDPGLRSRAGRRAAARCSGRGRGR
jgi:DNA-binding response OmpR family regulator